MLRGQLVHQPAGTIEQLRLQSLPARGTIKALHRGAGIRVQSIQRQGTLGKEVANGLLPKIHGWLQCQQVGFVVFIGLLRIQFQKGIQQIGFESFQFIIRPAIQLHGLQIIGSLFGDQFALLHVVSEIVGGVCRHRGEDATQFAQPIQCIPSGSFIRPTFEPAQPTQNSQLALGFHLLVGSLHAGRRIHVHEYASRGAHGGAVLNHRPGQHHHHQHHGETSQHGQHPKARRGAAT